LDSRKKTKRVKKVAELCVKHATISPEEIAAGLAGNKLRDIPLDEVSALAKQYRDQAYQEHKNAPLWGAGLGGGFGGFTGALTGAAHSGKGALIGGLAGLGLGGGLGALLGHAGRSSAAQRGEDLGSTVGGIAQSGRIPYELPGQIRTDDLLEYARGVQGNPEPLKMQDEEAVRNRLTNRLMLMRGAAGAIRGGLIGAMSNRDREDASGDAILGAALHGGVESLRGRAEARHMANKVLDLKSRGYGALSDHYYNDALNPSVFGY
jgi:hypothetical protein